MPTALDTLKLPVPQLPATLAVPPVQAFAPPDEPATPPPATTPPTPKVAGQVSSYSRDGWPIIDGTVLRLNGIGPLAPGEAKPVSDWIATHGNYLACNASQPGDYRCLTHQNIDLAQAILLNGAARTSAGAVPAYRDAEARARLAKRGVWR